MSLNERVSLAAARVRRGDDVPHDLSREILPGPRGLSSARMIHCNALAVGDAKRVYRQWRRFCRRRYRRRAGVTRRGSHT